MLALLDCHCLIPSSVAANVATDVRLRTQEGFPVLLPIEALGSPQPTWRLSRQYATR